MLTADEELEFATMMPDIGNERAYVHFCRREHCWKYSLKRPAGRVGVDYQVFRDVDDAYNVVQAKNFPRKIK